MKLPEHLLFASNAELAALGGLAFLLLAAATRIADRRRLQRQSIDHVGWVPWTGLFLVLAMVGLTLLALGVPALIRG